MRKAIVGIFNIHQIENIGHVVINIQNIAIWFHRPISIIEADNKELNECRFEALKTKQLGAFVSHLDHDLKLIDCLQGSTLVKKLWSVLVSFYRKDIVSVEVDRLISCAVERSNANHDDDVNKLVHNNLVKSNIVSAEITRLSSIEFETSISSRNEDDDTTIDSIPRQEEVQSVFTAETNQTLFVKFLSVPSKS